MEVAAGAVVGEFLMVDAEDVEDGGVEADRFVFGVETVVLG